MSMIDVTQGAGMVPRVAATASVGRTFPERTGAQAGAIPLGIYTGAPTRAADPTALQRRSQCRPFLPFALASIGNARGLNR